MADSMPEDSQNTNSGVTILVVDDDQVIRDSVTDLLQLSGYIVLAALSGIEALQIMQTHVPDLIITDVTMPEMDGYQLCETVRGNPAWATIPFLFLTARAQPSDIGRGYRPDTDQHLAKPFTTEDLLVAVQRGLK